jgi:hypothetical protein
MEKITTKAKQVLDEYKELQKMLDKAFPDAKLNMHGKVFRCKKVYKALANIYELSTELTECKEVPEESGGYSYVATAKAISPTGRYAYGVGACSSSEKRGSQCTRHNILSHAETRATVRAISSLCAFGDVASDEISEIREQNIIMSRDALGNGLVEIYKTAHRKGISDSEWKRLLKECDITTNRKTQTPDALLKLQQALGLE